MAKEILIGSICLSDIPKEVIKAVECKDGQTRKYLNVAIIERNEVSKFGHTHFISCSPKQEERKEGVNYIIGDVKPLERKDLTPTPEEIDNAPVADPDDLPF